MRIYEFAQQKNISSKELIENLQKGGFDVKSHMSVLDEKALSFLNKSIKDLNEPADKTIISLTESKPNSLVENKVSELSHQKTTELSPKNSEEKKSLSTK